MNVAPSLLKYEYSLRRSRSLPRKLKPIIAVIHRKQSQPKTDFDDSLLTIIYNRISKNDQH